MTRVTYTLLPQSELGRKLANQIIENAKELGTLQRVEETTRTIEICEVVRTIIEEVEE